MFDPAQTARFLSDATRNFSRGRGRTGQRWLDRACVPPGAMMGVAQIPLCFLPPLQFFPLVLAHELALIGAPYGRALTGIPPHPRKSGEGHKDCSICRTLPA